MKMSSSSKNCLKALGLNEQEAGIYTTLLAEGKLSILELSKKTEIPRSSVYKLCRNLSEKNFLEKIIEYPGNKVKAIPPNNLGPVLESQKNELSIMKKALDDLLTLDIRLIKHAPKTEVRYFKGARGMKQIVWNTLQAKDEMLGYTIWGRGKYIGRRFEDRYFKEMKKRKILDKIIINSEIKKQILKLIKNKSVNAPDETKRIRVIERFPFYISGDTYIYNNIYAVNFFDEKEIVGVEIENPEIVKVQKSIFNILWKIAKSLKNI